MQIKPLLLRRYPGGLQTLGDKVDSLIRAPSIIQMSRQNSKRPGADGIPPVADDGGFFLGEIWNLSVVLSKKYM